MEILNYTLIGIGLYFLSDWLLNRIEAMFGRRFQYRSLVFFLIIASLALISSQLIGVYSKQAG